MTPKSKTDSRGVDKNGIPHGSDFEILREPKKVSTCLVFGDGGTGKSTIGTLYSPQPVAFINFDRRAHHAVIKAQELGRKILYTQVPKPGNILAMEDAAAKKAGQVVVDHTMRNFEIAVRESEKGNVRSIVIDTGTELADAIKLATTGRLDRVKGDFGKSKHLQDKMWWNMFEIARSGEAHLIVLARAQAIWVNNEPTGNFKYRGPDVMFDAVDWAAQIRLKKSKRGKLEKEFELEIKKAGVNIEELGEVYTAEEWEGFGGPFVYSCLMQYEGSTEEDWK